MSSISFSYGTLKPGLLFVAAATLTVTALHLPPRFHRFFLLPTWFLTAWSLASIDGDITSRGPIGLDSYTAITCIIYLLILPRILLLETHTLQYEAKQFGKPIEPGRFAISPSRSSISTACWIWNNPRQLPFPRRVPGSSWSKLLNFAFFRIIKVGVIILIDRMLVEKLRVQITAKSTLFDFTPDQEPILRRFFERDDDPVSQHQLILRAFMCMSWIWANVLILESYHAVLSLLFVVVLRLDDPEDWPPLFGNPAEAWTVRRFWSKFWHRIATPTFASWARIISRHILRLKPGSAVDNSVVAFGIFFLSGLAHAAAAWRIDQGESSRDLLFFCANFVVIGTEILVSSFVRGLVKKTKYEALLRDHRAQMAGKALGFVWVFAWFFWATPRWMYSKTLRWSLKQAVLQSRA